MQLTRQKNYMELAKTDEQRLFVSVLFANKPISSYKKEEMGEIIELIAKWRYLVGINSTLEPIELKALTDFIQLNYGNLTVQEINLAINLSLKGTLDVDNRPYGSFSALYISTILNAYLDYRIKLLKEIRQIQEEVEEKQLLEQKSVPPPPEVQASDMRDILKNAFITYDKDKFFADPFFLIYNFLKKKGVFRKFSKENVEDIKIKAKKYAENYKTDQNSQVLSQWDSKRSQDSIYQNRGKHLFCEVFLGSFSSLSDFEQQFLRSVTEKDFI